MIYLSASSIKDFLKCSARFNYRKTSPEEAIQTVPQVEGKLVHKIIEECWDKSIDDWQYILDRLANEIVQYNVYDLDMDKIYKCLRNFYTEFPDLKSRMKSHDLKEYRFEQKIAPNIVLVGYMDYIIKDDRIVIDWKTGTTKTNISNDVQFIIYYEMFKKEFGSYPQVKQVNLSTCKVSDFYPSPKYINTLFDVIIPMIAKRIKKNEYYREGFYNGACYNCDYIGVCSKDA